MAEALHRLSGTLEAFLDRHARRGGGLPWLAVSGGADSMALLHAAAHLGRPFGVLHVDHGIRDDSRSDADFVREQAEGMGLRFDMCVLKGLATSEERRRQGLESAARSARYAWMASVAGPDGLVLTAHHRDDQRETRLLHLLRGGRAEALAGMSELQHDFGCAVARPFLGLPKSALLEALEAGGWPWREDATNNSRDHLRNRIRHELIPLLDDIRPGWEAGLERMGDVALEWRHAMQAFLDGPDVTAEAFPLVLLASCPAPLHALGLWGQPHGFGPAHAAALVRLADPATEVGRKLCSGSCCIVREREALVVRPLEESDAPSSHLWETSGGQGQIVTPDGRLNWHVEPMTADMALHSGDGTADLDLRALRQPLKLRRWMDGDRIAPLGMEGRQRIADILTQRKVPHGERNRQWVVEDAEGRIAWLVGHRIHRDTALPSELPEGGGYVLRLDWEPLR